METAHKEASRGEDEVSEADFLWAPVLSSLLPQVQHLHKPGSLRYPHPTPRLHLTTHSPWLKLTQVLFFLPGLIYAVRQLFWVPIAGFYFQCLFREDGRGWGGGGLRWGKD